ncbi:MAG: N-acetylmuramoyl-L-alanine amidase [Pseudomonas sp.]|nr:MAG: N-acetylmuramoyl-L-alanine amidase [Pseudomonas sp.]
MRYWPSLLLLAVTIAVVCCAGPSGQRPTVITRLTPPAGPQATPQQLYQEVRVQTRMIPKGKYGRRYFRPMTPRYITIHSTQNYTGDAFAHARALQVGALRARKRRGGNRIGFLTWHFTVQGNLAVQHLPTTEQGEHADFDGPGNNYSIGIEMCEHRGNNREATTERTAKLAAFLMYKYNIPLRNVVPHYHWPRAGQNPPNKNCPHFLMDNGRPGRKWQGFLSRVQAQYSRLAPGPVPRL